MELVSVIITTFNSEASIVTALNSVICQSHRNIEILLFDDCSMDRTVELARRSLVKSNLDYQIEVAENNSGGPAKGRNWGLSVSSGKFVAFLDADDIWFAHKIESQINLVNSTGFSIVGSYGLSSDSAIIGNLSGPVSPELLLIRNRLVLSTVLFVREIYELQGFCFNEGVDYQGVEDYDFFLRYSLSCVSIWVVSEPLIIYTLSSTSLSHSDIRINEARRLNVVRNLYINSLKLRIVRSIVLVVYNLKRYV